MDASFLANLGAYSAQVVCIAALGTIVGALLHVDAAGIRYAYWRVLLAACVLLPVLQVRRDPAELAATARAAADAAAPAPEIAIPLSQAAPAGAGIDWLFVAGVVLAAGVAARVVWMAASLLSLRRMRALGRPAPACAADDELQRLLGTRAEIRYVDGLRQPVTFGALRPVVLLPASLREHPEDVRRAVLCHELFHVQRRDWLWVLGEEAVRAILWFNPAVWWLIARVQLAREELVDELTVLATNQRRTYMEALLAFADETPLAPAAAFARRRHLFRRMVLLSKEAVMSSKRVVLSSVVMAMVMLAGGWYVVNAFPMTAESAQAAQLLTEPGPLEKAAKAVTPENPIPRRASSADAFYPADAEIIGLTGTVGLRLTLDEVGRVAEVRRTSLSFVSTNPSLRAQLQSGRSLDLQKFVEINHTASERQALLAGLQALEVAAFDAVRQWRYDPPHDAPISFQANIAVGTAQPPPPPPPPPAPLGAEGAVRIGGTVKPPVKVRDVRPVYPEIARAARVSGVVIIEAVIGPDGSVQEARVLRSIPLLDEAALDAVRQWRFTPSLMNGVPVPVIMTMTVAFRPE